MLYTNYFIINHLPPVKTPIFAKVNDISENTLFGELLLWYFRDRKKYNPILRACKIDLHEWRRCLPWL
jgi:hypothetical protein